jgi:polysaccharide biosynthesis PFTS motif protein
MMNRFGCKNVIYHWSDMTFAKAVTHAYTAHNVFYTWGPIHHEFEKGYHFYDKVEVVGCIFLKTYFDTLERDRKIGQHREAKRILICDDSFGNAIYQSEDVYLDGLDLVIEMRREIPDAEFIFKAKNTREGILDSFTDEKRRNLYLEKMMILNGDDQFTYHESTVQLETLIPLSDIVVNIGMSSPALIALIVGKEAVYYDQTGNEIHPLSQYKDKLFFDDKRMLIEHVKDVLNNRKSVFDDIDPDLLKKYEPFRDSKALERLIQAISEEMSTPL